MKKLYRASITIFLVILLINIVSTSCYAAGYDLEFVGEPECELISESDKGGWRYNITIKIKNVGDEKSEEITVNLTDEGLDFPEANSQKQNFTIEPEEIKTVVFPWVTTYDYDQTIRVEYYPADLGKPWNQYNHDSTSFKLIVGDDDTTTETGTPGFEIIIILLAISILLICKKKKLM